ncbi:ATP-dependent DNA helicase [Trichinella pseudospiralis]
MEEDSAQKEEYEQWVAAFLEIHGRKPKNVDFELAPTSVRRLWEKMFKERKRRKINFTLKQDFEFFYPKKKHLSASNVGSNGDGDCDVEEVALSQAKSGRHVESCSSSSTAGCSHIPISEPEAMAVRYNQLSQLAFQSENGADATDLSAKQSSSGINLESENDVLAEIPTTVLHKRKPIRRKNENYIRLNLKQRKYTHGKKRHELSDREKRKKLLKARFKRR